MICTLYITFATVLPPHVLPWSHIPLLPTLLPLLRLRLLCHAASSAALDIMPSWSPFKTVRPGPQPPTFPACALSPPLLSPPAPLDAKVNIHHQRHWPSLATLPITFRWYYYCDSPIIRSSKQEGYGWNNPPHQERWQLHLYYHICIYP